MSGFEIELPSSPDPLGDESVVIPPSSAAPPSTVKSRRVLQSSVSSRFSALPGTSPRKRMFALDVGDEITHQTIYVTVEAGPDGLPITRSGPGGSSVNRRLFGSPTLQTSPRRGVKTTTTTIPLRGLTDDEADAMSVPRRRRRSSGRPDTPTTAGPKKRKKGTPTPKASTRKPRGTPTPSSDVLQSEMPAVLDQPTPRRRGRPPKRKVDDAPPEQDDPNASQTAPRKRGRTARRQSLDADALDLLAADNDNDHDNDNDNAELQSHKSPTSQSSDVLQDPISDPVVGDGGAADLDDDEEEEDPFLAIRSDPPSEHDGRPRQGDQSMEFSDLAGARQYGQDPRVLEGQGSPPPEMDDYAPMMDYDDRSDGGSQHDEPMPPPARVQHPYGEELGDRGSLPGGPDDYAPIMDNDKSDVESQAGEPVHSAAHDPYVHSGELEDQGHLPGESDDYAPMVDRDNSSDIESQHSEATPRTERKPRHQSSELEDQGPSPGEPDDYAPVDHDDGSDRESRHSDAEHRSSELGDQGALPGESAEHAHMMNHENREDKESRHSKSTPRAAHVEHQSSELEDQGPLPGELDGYAPMVDHDDRSDSESHHSRHTAQSGGYPDNTVDPETFTMIGIETMPSLQGNKGAPTSDLPEIGENTSLFINKTLDSLRQQIVTSEADDGEVDLLGSRERTPAEVETERPAVDTTLPRHQDQPSNPPANRSYRSIRWSPARLEAEGPSAATSSPWNRAQSSQSPSIHLVQSRSQSLRRSKASLAHVASERSQYRKESSARTVRHHEVRDSPSSPDELNAVSDADSFSDIPEEVLAAAEPHEELQPLEGQIKDEHGWAVDVVQEVAAEKGYSHMVESAGFQHNDHYDETTTSTPNRPNQDEADDETISQRSVSRSAQSMRRSSQGTQHSSPPRSIHSHLDSNRLLTPPDETAASSNHGTPAGDQVQNAGVTSATPDDIGSSPPEITTFDQVDERQMSFSRRDSDTPANPPPSIHLQPVHERITYAAGFTTQTYGHRPGLSPIVRAGSRLQNILSDPPSPSGRSSVLGSPFKGSVKDSSPLEAPQAEDAAQNDASPKSTSQNPPAQPAPQSAQPPAESPAKSWAMSLAPLGRIKNMVSHFTSPKVDVAQAPEDPFGPSSPIRERPGSAFMDRIKQASREGSAHSSRASVARATSGDNDERSSAEDPTPRAPESNASSEKTQNTGMFGSGLFRRRLQHVEPSKSLDGAMDEVPRAMFVDRRSEQTQTGESEQRPAEREPYTRESRIKDAKQLPGDVQSQPEEVGQWSDQEAMQADDAPADDEQSEEEDIWAIEADRTASSPTAQQRANESINPFRKSGLSIDWGTRSTISQPGRSPVLKKSTGSTRQDQLEDLDNYSLIGLNSGDSNQPSAKKPSPEAQEQPKRADLSDFFSSSPNFIERERRKQALLAESAAQITTADQLTHIASPQMTGETQNTTSSSQRQPSSSSSRASPELPSPGAEARQRTAQAATSRASSSLTPERPRRPQHRPAPQPSQNDAALFETWSVSSPRAPSERPHVTDPLSDARPSSPDAIERPSTPVEHAGPGFGKAPDLKALPGRAASPSKSCLRSPLKPKTPGRVVGFTSSTLSPVAEALARAPYVDGASAVPISTASLPDGQRLSGRTGNESTSALAAHAHARPNQPHHRQQQQQRHQEQHYEHDQDEPADPPLSQTRWSRKHWLLLDEFLQSYRRDPRGFRAEYCSEVVMLSPEKRRSRSLLGKVVTLSSSSRGEEEEEEEEEEMVLEQWHLDVADAFRDEVGGWPEVALVKRLFALIVGEERRRLGLVPTRR